MIRSAAAVLALGLILGSGACGPTGDRNYAEPGDTGRASPNAGNTPMVPADSTAGVARPTGQPGVAGPVPTRSSDISAPVGKSPDPKQR